MADLHSKILDARPPLGVQILSISCSFWENLAKSYVGAPPGELAPPLGEILDPPLVSIVFIQVLYAKTSICIKYLDENNNILGVDTAVSKTSETRPRTELFRWHFISKFDNKIMQNVKIYF